MQPEEPIEPIAARICFGRVMHLRLHPATHRFSYPVYFLRLPMHALHTVRARGFSVNRFNLLSFHQADHGDGGDGLAWARGLLAQHGIHADGEVWLTTFPRVLGYAFKPVSFWHCHGRDGELRAVLAEVNNTFGERHAYVEPVMPGQLTEAGLRQEADKLFYVSPFMPMEQRYHFRLRPPGTADIAVRIHETDAEGPILAATFHGKAEQITALSCLRLAFAMPLMTLKVVAGIHWEALRLWVKGVTLVTRPAPPPPASHGGQFLSVTTDATRKVHHAG